MQPSLAVFSNLLTFCHICVRQITTGRFFLYHPSPLRRFLALIRLQKTLLLVIMKTQRESYFLSLSLPLSLSSLSLSLSLNISCPGCVFIWRSNKSPSRAVTFPPVWFCLRFPWLIFLSLSLRYPVPQSLSSFRKLKNTLNARYPWVSESLVHWSSWVLLWSHFGFPCRRQLCGVLRRRTISRSHVGCGLN